MSKPVFPGNIELSERSVRLAESGKPESKRVVGEPFVTLSAGPMHSRMTGEKIADITLDQLNEFARVFKLRKDQDPVVIDWQHASDKQKDPKTSGALGRITDVYVEGGKLWVVPEYNKRGAEVVTDADGDLWSSPALARTKTFARENGTLIGTAQLLAVTLTPRPQQVASSIGTVTLMENASLQGQEDTGMNPEQIKALQDELLAEKAKCSAAEAERDALKEELETLKAEKPEPEPEAAEGEDKPADAPAEEEPEGEPKPEDEDKVMALTELTENLGGTVTELTEKLEAEGAKVLALTEKLQTAECSAAVTALINRGAASPSERAQIEKCYRVEKFSDIGISLFSEVFASRANNSVVDLGMNGTGAKAETTKTPAEAVKLINVKVRELALELTEASPNHNKTHREML